MFISLTTAKFTAISPAKFWDQAIVATTAIANSTKENRFLVFVGQEFFFGHNGENHSGEINVNHLDINLDINLGNFSGAAISYRLEQNFRSGRYRHSLGFACT
jgi:hypothetical protein